MLAKVYMTKTSCYQLLLIGWFCYVYAHQDLFPSCHSIRSNETVSFLCSHSSAAVPLLCCLYSLLSLIYVVACHSFFLSLVTNLLSLKHVVSLVLSSTSCFISAAICYFMSLYVSCAAPSCVVSIPCCHSSMLSFIFVVTHFCCHLSFILVVTCH